MFCVQNVKTANSILRILPLPLFIVEKPLSIDLSIRHKRRLNTTYLPSTWLPRSPDTSFALYSLLDVCFLNYADAIHGNYHEE